MGAIAIKTAGLSKSYLVGHQSRDQERYTALRDVIARSVRTFARKTRDFVAGRQIVQGDEVEEFWALKDVSFEVERGEIVGIIGRNGAGKSTLLKILSRITEPTEGEVRIYGRVASLLEVGTGFHPELSGRENIFLNGAVLGMTRAEVRKKFDEIVAFAEVEKFLDTPVKRYSSGMYVRLAFAVAAHLEPEILIVDEVLAVGDAEFQKRCIGKMHDVATREGRTVLYVTHNMNAVEHFCDRVLWLEQGARMGFYTNVRDGVAAYLHRNRDKNAVSWHNSNNDFDNPYLKVENCKVHSAAPELAGAQTFPNNFPIIFVVSGYLKRIDPALNLGIRLYDEKGALLFMSMIRDVAESEWQPLTLGPCEFRLSIPPRLLNEGSYRIEVILTLHFREWLIAPGNGPVIEFSIEGGMSDSPFWVMERAGILAPVFHWKMVRPIKEKASAPATEHVRRIEAL